MKILEKQVLNENYPLKKLIVRNKHPISDVTPRTINLNNAWPSPNRAIDVSLLEYHISARIFKAFKSTKPSIDLYLMLRYDTGKKARVSIIMCHNYQCDF